jgi:WD40 repeat protein
VKVWDVATGKEKATLKEFQVKVRDHLAFSPDGMTLAYEDEDTKVSLLDLGKGCRTRTFPGEYSTRCVAFRPDGKVLASGNLVDGTITLWETATGQERLTLGGHPNFTQAVAFSPDGKTLASTGEDQCIRLWDARTGDALASIPGQPGMPGQAGVLCLAFSPDGEKLAAGTIEHTIKVWDLPPR